MYTSYDIGRQILQIRAYTTVQANGFTELPKDILSALLWLTSEWRNVEEMETLIKMGADPHEKNRNCTVLDNFMLGHDGTWRDPNSVNRVEEGVKMLVKYGVTREDLTCPWIMKDCLEMIQTSKYLTEFFKVPPPPVNVYWHLPRADKLESMGLTFSTVKEAEHTLSRLTNHKQYIALIQNQGKVTRYLVSKDCGNLSVIPMENDPKWSREIISNIVNFVMAGDDYPTLPCEDEK